MFKFIIILNFILLFSYNSLAQSFNKTIAMHGSTNRDAEARDTKVNINAPINKILKLAKIGTFNSLNPYIIKGIAPPGIKGLVIESLMTWSPDEPFSLYPGIAEAIRTPKDRKWVEFKIYDEAKFSDGKSINSEDIIFSWKTLKKYGRPHTRSYYSMVKKVEEIDDKKVKFYFLDKSNFEMPLIIGLMPVLHSKYWGDKDFTKTTLEPFISSGPYKISNIDTGRSITFIKNENWWKKDNEDSLGRYNFKKIRYDFYRDQNVALEAFLSGEFDINIENDSVRWENSYHQNSENKIIKKTFLKKSPSGMEAIILNTRRQLFQDRNVRKAVAILFPYEFINKVVNHGLLKQTYGPWDNSELSARKSPSDIANILLSKYKDNISRDALEQIENLPINERETIRESISLLKASGWKIINQKMTNIKSGKPLSFEIITNKNKMEKLLLIWKDKLKKIGVNLNIRIIDSSQFQNRIQTFDFDAIIFQYYMSLSPGNEQSIYWGSWAADQIGSRNYAGIKHKAIDDIIQKITNAKNRKNLIEYTRILDRILRSGKWFIPLFHDPLHRIAYQENIRIPKEIPLYGFNPWTAWEK
tara:strand:- start:66 stop:1820 length:1755 start_codon:yes stop_codon:yes gene_type:complete